MALPMKNPATYCDVTDVTDVTDNRDRATPASLHQLRLFAYLCSSKKERREETQNRALVLSRAGKSVTSVTSVTVLVSGLKMLRMGSRVTDGNVT